MVRFDGVHAFGYNSAESKPIWMIWRHAGHPVTLLTIEHAAPSHNSSSRIYLVQGKRRAVRQWTSEVKTLGFELNTAPLRNKCMCVR